MQANGTVFLVDDDAAICHALSLFIESSGYNVRTFNSAEAFLENVGTEAEGVVLLDQRMPGMSGAELQAELTRRDFTFPIIFITGHGSVQLSVKAIKNGAIDFLEKPFSNEDLLACIKEAYSCVDGDCNYRSSIANLRKCHASLTDREREVMQHIVAGLSNRKMAELMGISERTIEVHRSRVRKKMRAESIPDLVRKDSMCQKDRLLRRNNSQ